MYSSYWKPTDGRVDSTILTDHQALHRDEATHKAMQSDETELRPLDLETIMSSKAAVKFWYLHRPKTMAYVHKNATKVQSLGRAFAVRQLRAKHGAQYMADLARQDQTRRDADVLKELSEDERTAKAETDAAYDARVEASRRQRQEQIEAERQAEENVRIQQAKAASERRRLDEEANVAARVAREDAVRRADKEREREQAERDEERQCQEQEAVRLEALRLREEEASRAAEEAERERKAEATRLAMLEAARLAEEEAIRAQEVRMAEEMRMRQEEEERERLADMERACRAEKERVRAEEERVRAEEERVRAEEERIRAQEEEAALFAARARKEEERLEREAEEARVQKEKEHREQVKRKDRERKLAEAALAAKLAEEEAERIKQERIKQDRIQQDKHEKYEQSLSKDVPVLVRQRGPGRVVSYDKQRETYTVEMDKSLGGMQITVPSGDVNLDDERILSPRTKVDTPFGTGEVVGLDPHVGCYAINTEVNAPDNDQFLAFVQIKDVVVHVEEEEERAIVEDASLPIPEEIGLESARIVDSRIVNRTGNKFIQYKLEIRTTNYGTVFCWKRYSTFRSLCDRLMKENGMKRRDIPDLPHRHLVGNFSQQTIGERAEKLNLFLSAAVKAEHLQWGVRVDDQIAVYKRRNKRATQPSSQPNSRSSSRSSRSIFSRRR